MRTKFALSTYFPPAELRRAPVRSAGAVDFSRIRGTAFSGAVSGPAWHPTQARCSPRRIQNQPACRFTVLPEPSRSSICSGCSVGTWTKNDPSRSTGAVPSSFIVPLLLVCTDEQSAAIRMRTCIWRYKHSGREDSHSASRAGRTDGVSVRCVPQPALAEAHLRPIPPQPAAWSRLSRLPPQSIETDSSPPASSDQPIA